MKHKKHGMFSFHTTILAALFATTLMLVAFPGFSAAPKSGGLVTIGLQGEPETLNPLLAENVSEREIMQAIFSCLYRTDQNNNFVPDLLTKMPTSKNLTYHYELRKGVRFSDGHELDSTDVRFTWECFINAKIPVPDRTGWDEIKSFQIPTVSYKGKDGKTYKTYDKYHFNVTLKRVSVRYQGLWADTAIVPKHILEREIAENKAENAASLMEKDGKFSRNPVGSGPFVLKEWKAENYLRAVRNPAYFRAGQPYLEGLVWRIIPNANTMLDRFLAGEIDICGNIQPDRYHEAVKVSGVKIVKTPTYIYNHIELNLNDPSDLAQPHPILGDRRVRQALDYAFPRERLVEQVLENLSYPAYGNLPPASWAYNEAAAKPRYNPEKAGQLLDEAAWVMGADGYRYRDGKKLQLTLYTNAGHKFREEVGRICRDEWRRIGVDLVLKPVDLATLSGDVMKNRRFDCLLIAWAAGTDPDAKSLWHSSQIPTGGQGDGQNYTGYRNATMDKLLEDALATDDRAARRAIYLRTQEILAEDVPYIFVDFYANLDGVKAGLEGFASNPHAAYTWNCQEWYWAI